MKRATVAKSPPTSAPADVAPANRHDESQGSRAGVPMFLRAAPLASAAGRAAASARPAVPGVQTKCACGGTCAKCAAREEDQALQKKGAGADASGDTGSSVHDLARRGVDSAHEPLPHFDRIQASFGSRDLSGIKAQVGGSAATANEQLGSVGYTVGDRVGFRSSPDIRLAAHEATHVVQQRAGVHLEDGVGHPGDAYEQHADAVAEAVAHGQSAEPILESGPARASGAAAPGTAAFDGAPVQHQLAVNATRLFEPEARASQAAPSGAEGQAGGATGGGGAEAAASPQTSTPDQGDAATDQEAAAPQAAPSSTGGASSSTATSDPGAPTADASSDQTSSSSAGSAGGGSSSPATSPSSGSPASTAASTAADGGGGGSPATGGGGGTVTSSGTGPSCAGGGQARCYDAPSEQPAQEPDETPPNPDATHSEEQTSDEGEEDLPEPDDCPPPSQVAAQAEAAAPSGSASTAGGASPSAAPEGATGTGGAQEPATTGDQAPPASAESGGASTATGGGGGAVAGVGPQGAPMAGGASPLDGAIGAAEGQRDSAVGAYGESSAMLAAASDNTAALRGRTAFADMPGETAALAVRRDDASQRANEFFSGSADRLDTAIAFVTQQVPEQLGAQAESAKSAIAASIEEQKGAISGRIEVARGQARADAAGARQQVGLQAEAFIAAVEAETDGAIATLTAAHTDATAQVAELETSTLDRINQIYADGRVDLSALGETIGAEATATGESYAATYRGFRHCTENGFWDGDLSERRSEAQEDAARSVAKGYHDRIVESAHKRAREITKAGRKEDRCTIIGAATAARDSLDSQFSALVTALQGARDQSIEQAGTTRDSIVASIDDSLATTLRQLDQQEHDQRQAADDTGYLQQVLQEQIAHAGAAALQRTVASAATALQSALGQVQTLFATSQPPDPQLLDQALATVAERVNGAVDGLQASIEGGLSLAADQLAGAAQEGLGSLQQVTAGNDESTATLSGGFTASMSQIGGTDNFAAQRGAFTQLMQQSAASGAAGLTQVVDGMAEGCDRTTAAAAGKLTQAHTSLEQNLRQSKQNIACDITSKADEAASHEAPAWKRLIAILLIIIVIVIVIAVIVLTAGGALAPLIAAVGPIAAAAIAGAVVGAVTSALITIATDLWGNRALSASRIAKAALVGAITGAIGGAAGAWAGAALQGFSVVVQLGGALAVAGGLDVVTQFVMGGFSFEHFSLANLGLTLLITIVTFGIAHYAAARVQAPKVGGNTPPATPPGETTTTTPPASGETTTTTAPAETTTPTTPPAETTTPATPPTETTTPTTPPAETTTPATPPTETTTPTTPPAETTTPATPPAETTTPATPPAETTTPATPPAETTTPPATPSEEIPRVPPAPEEVPRVPPTADEPVPAPQPAEEAPRTAAPAEEAPRAPAPEETAPSKNSEGRYDFEGRDARAIRRDANAEPYPGESEADAAARARQAQQEIVNRLQNLQPCFVAGTLVLTVDGPRSIEEIGVGQLVIAMDPTDPDGGRPAVVLQRFRGESDSIFHVRFGRQAITCTHNHRFFVADKGWVAARDLAVGDRLLTPDGALVEIEGVGRAGLERAQPTYNLRVAELSTYFVGGTCPVLVHNANPNFNRELWWLFGKKATVRPTDVDGVSLWRTQSEQDVTDMFKIRRGIEQRSSSDPHQAYTADELAAKGVSVEPTEGNGPMAGRLQHGSARPKGSAPGDLSEAQITEAVDGINKSTPTEKATPKTMGCK